MIRVTLVDPQQTVSFHTTEEIARRLVAACAANPDAVGELLLAAEIFWQGIAAALMVELMSFDKTLRRHTLQHIHQTLHTENEDHRIIWNAFQVVDDYTKNLAHKPDAHLPLLLLELHTRTIAVSGDFHVQTTGELLAHNGRQQTDRAITYVLPKEWAISGAPR